MQEIWKDIPNYDGLYQVSNLGRVKSLVGWNGKKYIKREKILKGGLNKKGYIQCVLSNNGIHKTVKIHRLVALYFIKNNKNKPQVNHIDCDKLNNKATNLEWVTNKENREHACVNGLHFKLLRGKENDVCDYYLSNNVSVLKTAEVFNSTREVVGRILKERKIKIRKASGKNHYKRR